MRASLIWTSRFVVPDFLTQRAFSNLSSRIFHLAVQNNEFLLRLGYLYYTTFSPFWHHPKVDNYAQEKYFFVYDKKSSFKGLSDTFFKFFVLKNYFLYIFIVSLVVFSQEYFFNSVLALFFNCSRRFWSVKP